MAKLTVPFNGGSGGNNADLESIKDRVDELEDDVEDLQDKMTLVYARNNAYMEIKNSLGTIDILTSDWVENTGDTEYPYKWELTNGYLEGAVNCIVVYSKDSDTSMLSATTGIDEENGKLIIYASELPSDTISIEKIAVFNDLNAYINYSNEIVQQVLQNTSAISDINNVKLPLYLKKQYQYNKDGKNTTHKVLTSQPNSNNDSTFKIANDQSFEVEGGGNFENKADLTLKTDSIQLKWRNGTDTSNFKNHELNIDTDGFELKYYEKTSGVANTHSLTFDANGDLKVDGNAVGGGKQLYQHILKLSITGMADQYVSIINDSNDAFDFTALKNYLNTNNFSSGIYLPIVSSSDGTGVGLYYDGGSSIYLKTTTGNSAFGNASISDRRVAL